MTKTEAKRHAIDCGKDTIRKFFQDCEKTGTVYYSIPSVSKSGMSRTIKLYTVNDKREIVQLWPSVPGLDIDAERELGGYSDALTLVAKEWGFNFKARAFRINGCGMNMVFALIDDLRHHAGIDADIANKLRWESL